MTKTYTNADELRKIFEYQLQTLKIKGFSRNLIEELSFIIENVISTAIKLKISRENLPFLPVIPRSYYGVNGLMSFLRSEDGNVGLSNIQSPSEIKDQVKNLPRCLYYIFDVNLGSEFLNNVFQKAESVIASSSRSSLIVDEAIALAIHSRILSEHGLACCSSMYDNYTNPDSKGNSVLYISGNCILDYINFQGRNKLIGVPSCRFRSACFPECN